MSIILEITPVIIKIFNITVNNTAIIKLKSGPARADIPKVNNKYRWIVTLKGCNREFLTSFLRKVSQEEDILKTTGKVAISVSFHGR